MQKWEKRDKFLTLVDPLHKWWTSSLLRSKPASKLHIQPSRTSVPRERFSSRCLCAILRPKTHTNTPRKRDIETGYIQTLTLELKALKNNA